MDFGRASALELLRGLPTSRDVLRPSKPHISLYSTKIEFRSPLGGGGLDLTFSTPSARRSKRVFIGGLCRCLGRSLGSGGLLIKPASNLTWPGGQALWRHHLSHIGYPSCRLKLTHVEDGFCKYAEPWPTGPTLARLGLGFVPRYPLVSYFR
jgi:hypothetical protein